ncbi:MAG: polysaccharide deacetylase family protein [Planctomycetota bacterium]|nr:polysaccharide deacetylase family protein [Planctomycetota bacterium]
MSFQWPDGKKAAITVSFDDARLSQIDVGIPLLNEYDVKGTFYVSFGALEKRLEGWKAAVVAGHEIGNHTVNHPCSGNFAFARSRANEDYTLDRMESELIDANAKIEEVLGVIPTTFAYPCGQKFVGRGENVKSYVPLVAKHFDCGRGFKDESENCPEVVDLAQAMGIDFDRATFAELLPQIKRAVEQGGWLFYAGHEVGDDGRQMVQSDTLRKLCEYCGEHSEIWLDTAAKVSAWIKEQQG